MDKALGTDAQCGRGERYGTQLASGYDCSRARLDPSA